MYFERKCYMFILDKGNKQLLHVLVQPFTVVIDTITCHHQIAVQMFLFL